MSSLNHTLQARADAAKAIQKEQRETPPRFRSRAAFFFAPAHHSRNSFVSVKSKQQLRFHFKPKKTRFARAYVSDESRILNTNIHQMMNACTTTAAAARNEQEIIRPASSCWNVDKIDEISPFYHLERSHEYIQNKTPKEVASQISDCLKKEFAIVSYDDIQAIAYVETTADKSKSDYCKLQIRLYKGSSSSLSSSVLVEVQRRTGCSMKFNSTAKKILCAVKGVEYRESVRASCLTIDPPILAQGVSNSNHSALAYAS